MITGIRYLICGSILSIDNVMWLSESKIVNHCFNSTEPTLGINPRVDKEDYHNNIEIDFLIRNKKKICPVEVKSGEYKKHTSIDRFSSKYSSKVGTSYIICMKDLSKDENVVAIPVYMTFCL